MKQAGTLLDRLLESGEATIERVAANQFNRGRVFDPPFFSPSRPSPTTKKLTATVQTISRMLTPMPTPWQGQHRFADAERIYQVTLETLRQLAKANTVA